VARPAAIRNQVSVLSVDPDLGSGIDAAELPDAERHAIAAVLDLRPPSWDPTPISEAANAGWLGLLVIDGLMIRCVSVGKRTACELFGPGDLVRPWDADGEYEPLPISMEWRIVQPTRLALLNHRFAARISRWPQITGQLISRVARRARYLALSQAATHLPRVHSRLLILFWLLAERWGTVGPDGVRVTLPLTHELLAMLIGAQRPSVTVGLRRLADAGLLTRLSQDRWLLTDVAVERLREPESLGLLEAVEAIDLPELEDEPAG
jgi:CRP-like cAMP-binding protein